MISRICFSLVILFACSPSGRNDELFDEYSKQKVVRIFLKRHGLDSIPPAISKLRNVENLTIDRDSVGGWTVYPPVSAMRNLTFSPPFKHLPNEISSLTTLRSLTLVNLDLTALPDNFGMLNLDTLNLSFNKLTLANDVGKLAQLRHLRHLTFMGNNVDSISLETLRKKNPNLTVIY